jgi:hypothetical protein
MCYTQSLKIWTGAQEAAVTPVPTYAAQGIPNTDTPPVPANSNFGRAAMGNPGLTEPQKSAQPEQPRFEAEKERLKAWRAKHHKVDAAGFV